MSPKWLLLDLGRSGLYAKGLPSLEFADEDEDEMEEALALLLCVIPRLASDPNRGLILAYAEYEGWPKWAWGPFA